MVKRQHQRAKNRPTAKASFFGAIDYDHVAY